MGVGKHGNEAQEKKSHGLVPVTGVWFGTGTGNGEFF